MNIATLNEGQQVQGLAEGSMEQPSLTFAELVEKLLALFSGDDVVVEDVEEALLAYK
jgi:hypothetical protein